MTITSIGDGLWDEPSTWDCNCIPEVDDRVVIADGTTVTIDNNYVIRNHPGPTVTTPADEGVAGGHAGQNNLSFIHRGDLRVESGGTFQKTGTGGNNNYILLAGVADVLGTLNTSDRLYNLGTLNVPSGVTVNLGNDYVIGLSSRSNIDGMIFSADDIYVVGALAVLCGEGAVQILDVVQLFPGDLELTDQMCDGFSIIDEDGNIIITGGNTALPIVVRAFYINRDQLIWEVLEKNVHYYEIMFSENGMQWEPIGILLARGDGEQIYHYDLDQAGFYFIQSVDFDGTLDQTGVVAHLDSRSEPNLRTNLLQPNMGLQIENASRLVKISLISLNGQVTEFPPSSYLPLQLKEGVYVVVLHTLTHHYTERIIIR